MSHHTNIDQNLEGDDDFLAWKYRISPIFEENELDTYISGEVPILEGEEAKSLTQEELGQGQEDHCRFNYTTSVFP